MRKLKLLLAFATLYLLLSVPCFSQDLGSYDNTGIKLGRNVHPLKEVGSIVDSLGTKLLSGKGVTSAVRLGLNRHWLTVGSFDFDAKIGLLLGMSIKKPHGKFLASVYEWQFIQMGYRYNNPIEENLEKVVIDRTYLQLSSGLCLTPTKFIDIQGDMYLGLLARNKQKWFYDTGVQEEEDAYIRTVDIGGRFGATIWLNKIGIGAEYYRSLITTNDNPNIRSKYTNHAFAITAKYTIN